MCRTQSSPSEFAALRPGNVLIDVRFTAGMIDAMNAEVSLGTVANVRDAVQWLGYTYMFVRMKRNPFVYGRRFAASSFTH
jgi:antiviral helicase SLH1